MRILVVDDEVNLAASLQRGLAAEGFSVDVAHDGEEALWAATEQAYDLVVLDHVGRRRLRGLGDVPLAAGKRLAQAIGHLLRLHRRIGVDRPALFGVEGRP